ncbi:MAG: DUF3365 domain-containing protein [Coriobacteriales bacterium]|nr:DUF3365 domain-containing protein [Coriobacteriales bacterium]
MSYQIQESDAKERLLEQSRTLSLQMEAVWDFIDANQDLINTDADGSYNFKGLQCSLAGTSVGKLFSARADHTIRYVSTQPRNEADAADEIESVALAGFASDTNLTEYYTISETEGQRSFRYLAPILAEESCLDCHGEPAGEIDVTGFPKEGVQAGDILGAISITSPMAKFESALTQNTIREALTVFVVLAASACIISFIVSRRITTPLGRFEAAVHEVGEGNIHSTINAEEIGATGEIQGLVTYFNEMLKRLQDLYENLENEVAIRTDQLSQINSELVDSRNQLEQANELLKQESKYKSDFVSSMSHELRTPLTSIIAFTEILLTDINCNDEQRAAIAQEIMGNSEVLLHLINDILDTAKLDAGKVVLEFSCVDIVDIIGMVDSAMAPLAKRSKVAYSSIVDADIPLLTADEEYLRIIIKNLVENAIKFTPENGTVIVHASFDESKSQMEVTVSDTGSGIPEQERLLIFDMFTQGSNSSSRNISSGKGLGLAIARELAVLHNGYIDVTSNEGKGSVFTLVLPVSQEKCSEEL